MEKIAMSRRPRPSAHISNRRGAAARKRPARMPLLVEQLGDRVVPAVTVSFTAGVLTVAGDATADIAVLRCDAGPGSVKVNDADPSGGAVACTAVTAIQVAGNGGGDTIDLSAVLPADFTSLTSVSIDGGAGDDVL